MTSIAPRRAAVYLRQSLDVQEGIARQERRCLALVESRGWELVATFTDNHVSASKSRDSAQWADLLALARSGGVDVVVATKLDRLARRVSDVIELQDIGLAIATAEGDIDTTTASGRFQAQLLAALAELEAARKGERHREAHADRAARGVPRTTKRPYGWKAGGMALEPREAEHLRTAITNIRRGGSIRAEVRRMNDAGERTPRYASGSGGREWTSRSLVSVLDNPRIAGVLVYQGVEQPESLIEPVVPREEWEEYRAIRRDPARLTRRPGRTPLEHWLSGVIECTAEGCDGLLSATTISARGGGRVPYYRCRSEGPGHVAIEATLAERETRAQVYAQLLRRRGEVGDDSRLAEARKRIAALADTITRATEAELTGSDVARKTAAKVKRQAEAELEAAREELNTLLAQGTAEAWADIAETYFRDDDGFFREAFETFCARWDDTPVERRREITRSLLRVQLLRAGTPRTQVEFDRGQVVTVVRPARGRERLVFKPRHADND